LPARWKQLKQFQQKPVLVSLALREWYEELLKRNGFDWHQDIVVFMYDDPPPPPPQIDPVFHSARNAHGRSSRRRRN
jgi:hypothetical protein